MRSWWLLLGLLMGCPREVPDPADPPAARCVRDADCTPDDAVCGLVWACVDGFCETSPSRAEPCLE